MNADAHQVTEILDAFGRGDPGAADRLLAAVYDELRVLAAGFLAGEGRDHTLQATALVHEAYLKLVDQTRVHWKGQSHFRAVAALAMRRVLLDHAKARRRDKRGGGWQRVALDDDNAGAVGQRDLELVTLDEALSRLQSLDQRQYSVVELRFLGGLTVEEVAAEMQVSPRLVEDEWAHARIWLRRELSKGDSS